MRLSFSPPVIAHRGASAVAPENTMPAFLAAAAAGARWIETDVKLSRDGVAVLLHDDDLRRTAGVDAAVAALDWAELAGLDAGSWFDPAFAGTRIPRLTELLQLATDRTLYLNLELKPCPGRAVETTEATLRELKTGWPQGDAPVLLSSFEMEALLTAQRLRPDMPRGLLLDGWTDDWAELARRCGAASLHPDAAQLTAERLRRLLDSGLPVIPYVVNDTAQATALLQSGVTAVFADDPAAMISALAARF